MKFYNYKGDAIFDSSEDVGNPVLFNFSELSETFPLNSNITKSYGKITDVMGEYQYVGGICVNKKIYCAPNQASSILVCDTENDIIYNIGKDLGTTRFKYTGLVYWKGYVYTIPRGVNTMLRIDPISDDVTIIGLKTNYPLAPHGDYRDSHHYNGVISDNGYMYCPPAYSSDKLLKIDMDSFECEELPFESSVVSTWVGCVKYPDENKIIFLANTANNGGKTVFRIWDCNTDTYTDVVSNGKRACYDMVYDPRYNSFIGFYPTHCFALSLTDYSIIDSGVKNGLSTGYGVSIGLDGHYYHIEGATVYEVVFDGTTFTWQNNITTSDNVGSSTPLHAGQAVDNNGNIYGIPGSGAMTKLTFNNVVKGWSDYIVSSQYYGKY